MTADMPPRFEPPYDSPMEDELAWALVKRLGPQAKLTPQYDARTICGRYFIDFVVEIHGKRVGIECDGREFHNVWRDLWRDAMILGAATVDVIYRVRAADIYHRIDDVLFFVSLWDPDLFSEHQLKVLDGAASDDALEHLIDLYNLAWMSKEGHATVVYRAERRQSGAAEPSIIAIERRSRFDPVLDYCWWRDYFEHANEQGGGNLDLIMRRWASNKVDHKRRCMPSDAEQQLAIRIPPFSPCSCQPSEYVWCREARWLWVLLNKAGRDLPSFTVTGPLFYTDDHAVAVKAYDAHINAAWDRHYATLADDELASEPTWTDSMSTRINRRTGTEPL
jgi:hypothetical protein